MQLATYESVLRKVLQLLGEPLADVTGDTDGPEPERWRQVRDNVSERLEEWWKAWWWPDLMRTERRPLREPHVTGRTYATASEVWHEPSGKYYHAIRSTNSAPATYDGAEWDTTVAYWAESKPTYSAANYLSTTAYVAGDQVYYPETARWYQCHTASTGHAPTDADYWGALIEFIPRLPRVMTGYTTIGDVRAMYATDPRRNGNAERAEFEAVADGFAILDPNMTRPWVVYRVRAPRLVGEAFDPAASYTPTSDEGEGVVSYEVNVTTQDGIPGLAVLKTIVDRRANQVFYVLYQLAPGDGGGGEYYWDPASTELADDNTYVLPNDLTSGDPGRFVRLNNVS